MTRIIAGTAGGRRLETPPGSGTRPTSERVREAMFSSLESMLGGLHGVRVLDLYAGSGALGLEALSRGAEHATLVESHRRTAQVAQRNVRSLGLSADVVDAKVETYLQRPPTRPYDLVLLDPPYPLEAAAVVAVVAAVTTEAWWSSGGVIVVERSARDAPFDWPGSVEPVRDRRYGETALWYGRSHD
ncbi:16S rRNA (guanine966-N2)-methyltransferase [Mumia flava]|uniref:16S rRNA (Guanine966-N2)-methyltransferase n=1 Tax=Mumia flava TaxID=1348852 RepID=A0A0B2BAS1_9ACTN|nr:16S rRNA (guanine(966)-N(2))-methyltransferase RsmD [Mumia flava]PJJ53855.1 16S rRNA (guanine966-N2)-methyltransferase [Mumia flava]